MSSFGTKKDNFGTVEGPNTSLLGSKNDKNENGNFFLSIQLNHMTLKWLWGIKVEKLMKRALTSGIFYGNLDYFFSAGYLLIIKTLDDWIFSLNFTWNIGQNHFNQLGNESFRQYWLKPLEKWLNHFNQLKYQRCLWFWCFFENSFNQYFNLLIYEYLLTILVKVI